MYASGDRASWLNAVAASIMDGGTPPSIEHLNLIIPGQIVTASNDGHVTAAAKFGEKGRDDYQAGWRIIIDEMLALLREQGFVGGTDQALTWIKPLDGTWSIQMPEGDRQLTVFGQRERRMSRDRAFVGERSETDVDGFSRVGVPSMFEGGRIHPLDLMVESARGNITHQKFELHPLALALPPMTESERETLRASIERDGVKVPVVIYQKKILDGRNRAYHASMLKKPIRIVEFEGTEEEARRHVAILNLHRRHLTTPQRYLVADNLFGEQAEKEAAESYRKAVTGPRQSVLKIAPTNQENGGGKSHERASKLAKEAGITGVTPMGMRLIKELRDAPETKARVLSGEIQVLSRAVHAARIEKGEEQLAPIKAPGINVHPRSANKHLGEIMYHFKCMLNEREMVFGDTENLRARSREIRRLHNEFDKCLKD